MAGPSNPERPQGSADEPHNQLIERLFQDHNESLLRFLAARLGSRHEAREIAQEAYVRLLKLDTPGAVSYLRAFLFKTASNLAIDRLRTRAYRERSAPLEFFKRFAAPSTPERDLSGTQEMQILSRLIAELPPKCQYAFVANRLRGVDVCTLATEMQLSESMVRRYITRALMHCRLGLDNATGSHHEHRE